MQFPQQLCEFPQSEIDKFLRRAPRGAAEHLLLEGEDRRKEFDPAITDIVLLRIQYGSEYGVASGIVLPGAPFCVLTAAHVLVEHAVDKTTRKVDNIWVRLMPGNVHIQAVGWKYMETYDENYQLGGHEDVAVVLFPPEKLKFMPMTHLWPIIEPDKKTATDEKKSSTDEQKAGTDGDNGQQKSSTDEKKSPTNLDLAERCKNIHVVGYPGEDRKRGEQWGQSGEGEIDGLGNIYYDIDTTGGQSGCPIFVDEDGLLVVCGVHSGYIQVRTKNVATALTPDKQEFIKECCQVQCTQEKKRIEEAKKQFKKNERIFETIRKKFDTAVKKQDYIEAGRLQIIMGKRQRDLDIEKRKLWEISKKLELVEEGAAIHIKIDTLTRELQDAVLNKDYIKAGKIQEELNNKPLELRIVSKKMANHPNLPLENMSVDQVMEWISKVLMSQPKLMDNIERHNLDGIKLRDFDTTKGSKDWENLGLKGYKRKIFTCELAKLKSGGYEPKEETADIREKAMTQDIRHVIVLLKGHPDSMNLKTKMKVSPVETFGDLRTKLMKSFKHKNIGDGIDLSNFAFFLAESNELFEDPMNIEASIKKTSGIVEFRSREMVWSSKKQNEEVSFSTTATTTTYSMTTANISDAPPSEIVSVDGVKLGHIQYDKMGLYNRQARPINEKPSYKHTTKDYSIWWVSELSEWCIGNARDIGTSNRIISTMSKTELFDPIDYEGNWKFWNGTKWTTLNDIHFRPFVSPYEYKRGPLPNLNQEVMKADASDEDLSTWCLNHGSSVMEILPELFPNKKVIEAVNLTKDEIFSALQSNNKALDKTCQLICGDLHKGTIEVTIWYTDNLTSRSFRVNSNITISELIKRAAFFFQKEMTFDVYQVALSRTGDPLPLDRSCILENVVTKNYHFVLVDMVQIVVISPKEEAMTSFNCDTRLSVQDVVNMAVKYFRDEDLIDIACWKFGLKHVSETHAYADEWPLDKVITDENEFQLMNLEPKVAPVKDFRPSEKDKHLDYSEKYQYSVSKATGAAKRGDITTPTGYIYVKSNNSKAPYYHQIEVKKTTVNTNPYASILF